MSFFQIFFIAFALSLDACAVSVANGVCNKNISYGKAFLMAFSFGLFQAGMPVIGWFFGISLERIISSFDHWIAFLLLGVLGVKMIWNVFEKQEKKNMTIQGIRTLLLLSLATSIDALVVGVSFAFVPVSIWYAVSVIGVVTFFFSLISLYAGKLVGTCLGRKAEVFAGLILLGIGIKILLSHIL
ncbi:MAG: manganese efflux pump MntP family protein [Candidatus Magasanikbacteria bacterium]